MSQDFNAKLNLLVRSEKALLKLEIRKKSRQAVFIALGLIAILATLVMLNVTAYLYLSTLYSTVIAAAILTGLNLVVAIIFFTISSRQELGAEAEAMQEIRDFAWGQIADDIDEVKQDVSEFRQSIQSAQSVFKRDFMLLKELVPIIRSLFGPKKEKQSK